MICNIGLIVIYFKNGGFDLIKTLKIILLFICLHLIITNLSLVLNSLESPSIICSIIGASKQICELAINTIQITLIFITYISVNHHAFIDNHKIWFKVIIILSYLNFLGSSI